MQNLHSERVQTAARGLLRHLRAGDVHPIDFYRMREALTGDPLDTTLSRDRLLELANEAAAAPARIPPTIWHSRLERIPVHHTCDHFEVRLTRWHHQSDRDRGYLMAGNPCSVCDAQGRPSQPSYPSLEAAQAAAMAK